MIKKINLPSGEFLFVEVERSNSQTDKQLAGELLESNASETESTGERKDLPEGSRETGARKEEGNNVAASLLKKQLVGLAKMSLDALAELKPQEVTIEAHVKFAGDVKVIPFIASAKGDGGLKITLTWRE